MTVKKLPSGKWLMQCFPFGRDGKRVRKQFATKSEALAYERHIIDEHANRPWIEEKRESRTLYDLIQTWHRAHGITLEDGEKRKSSMEFAYESMGRPLATEFTAKLFSSYREKRLSGEISRSNRVEKVAPRTVNLELAYFRAMFNELIRLDEWNGPHPLEKVRAYRTAESELAYLELAQAQQLLQSCSASQSDSLLLVVKICLATGARWSEAEKLTKPQILPRKITFIKTKGKRNRTVPISQELYDELIAFAPKGIGNKPLFKSCYSAFRTALKRTGIEPPDGQLTHILRHTFASHFMMAGGNILVLQRILGHTDIKVTMRYAHFAPEHLFDAVALNPLALMENGSKMAAQLSDI